MDESKDSENTRCQRGTYPGAESLFPHNLGVPVSETATLGGSMPPPSIRVRGV